VKVTRHLFDVELPPGFHQRVEFIDDAEEQSLLSELARLQFSAFELRGVVARRRVAFFGQAYDGRHATLGPLPAFLRPLRERVSSWAKVSPDAFAMALINEYPPGAPIGWHRDAPQYDIIAGVCLLSSCRLTFRPYRSASAATPAMGKRRMSHETLLERRSAYLITGLSRSQYEHHIPAVSTLRYSITFRTLRA
jgi:alkylated DNA repair dioxygenase AlkB